MQSIANSKLRLCPDLSLLLALGGLRHRQYSRPPYQPRDTLVADCDLRFPTFCPDHCSAGGCPDTSRTRGLGLPDLPPSHESQPARLLRLISSSMSRRHLRISEIRYCRQDLDARWKRKYLLP